MTRVLPSHRDFSKEEVLKPRTKDTAERKLLLLATAEHIQHTKEAFTPTLYHTKCLNKPHAEDRMDGDEI